jgi:hypothetical protein
MLTKNLHQIKINYWSLEWEENKCNKLLAFLLSFWVEVLGKRWVNRNNLAFNLSKIITQ